MKNAILYLATLLTICSVVDSEKTSSVQLFSKRWLLRLSIIEESVKRI